MRPALLVPSRGLSHPAIELPRAVSDRDTRPDGFAPGPQESAPCHGRCTAPHRQKSGTGRGLTCGCRILPARREKSGNRAVRMRSSAGFPPLADGNPERALAATSLCRISPGEPRGRERGRDRRRPAARSRDLAAAARGRCLPVRHRSAVALGPAAAPAPGSLSRGPIRAPSHPRDGRGAGERAGGRAEPRQRRTALVAIAARRGDGPRRCPCAGQPRPPSRHPCPPGRASRPRRAHGARSHPGHFARPHAAGPRHHGRHAGAGAGCRPGGTGGARARSARAAPGAPSGPPRRVRAPGGSAGGRRSDPDALGRGGGAAGPRPGGRAARAGVQREGRTVPSGLPLAGGEDRGRGGRLRYHSSRPSFEGDRRRDAQLAATGIHVVRFTWRQITEERVATGVRLWQILARGTGGERRL